MQLCTQTFENIMKHNRNQAQKTTYIYEMSTRDQTIEKETTVCESRLLFAKERATGEWKVAASDLSFLFGVMKMLWN